MDILLFKLQSSPFSLRKSSLDKLALLNSPLGWAVPAPSFAKAEGPSQQHPSAHRCSKLTCTTGGSSGQAETSIIGMQHGRLRCAQIPGAGRGGTLTIFKKFQVIIKGSSRQEVWDPASMPAWSLCLLQHKEFVFWREPRQICEIFVQSCSDRMSHGNNHTNLAAGKK